MEDKESFPTQTGEVNSNQYGANKEDPKSLYKGIYGTKNNSKQSNVHI